MRRHVRRGGGVSGRRRRAGSVGTGWGRRRGRPDGAGRRPVLTHQLLDLVACERSAEVAHRPPGREHLRLVLAGAAQDELALVERADRVAHRRDVDAAVGGAHAVEQAVLVAFGLQPSDHPRPGVGDRLVVDVDGVLGGQHHTDAERPRLLHQRHDRLLRRRHLRRGEVAHDLVEVEQRAEVGRAALAAHPGDELGEHQRGHELALFVGEMGGGDDRAPWGSFRGEQHGVDVEGSAFTPRGERRRREQPVELEGQLLPVLRWEELVELEHAQLLQGWVLDPADQRGQVEGLLVGPGVLDEIGQEDVLTARQRVGGDADESEQAGDEPLDLVGDRLRVVRRRDLQRPDDVQLHAGARSWGVDGQIAGVTQRLDLIRSVPPAGEPSRPCRRLGRGEVVG